MLAICVNVLLIVDGIIGQTVKLVWSERTERLQNSRSSLLERLSSLSHVTRSNDQS